MKYKCVSIISDINKNGRSAVGLFKRNQSYEIVTPYGLLFPEAIERKDVTNFSLLKMYIKSIQKALNSKRVRSELKNESNSRFNPSAALRILYDYIENGVYREYEQEYVIKEIGKIDFKKTAKQVRPLFSQNEIYYNKFVVRSKKIASQELVSMAQISVINHFLEHGGELIFGESIFVSGPKIEMNRGLVYRLQEILSHSFNSRKQQLIRWIIEYINGAVLNEQTKGLWQYTIVASTLWEEMVDACISNQKRKDKTIFGKKYSKIFLDGSTPQKGSSTEHDTIYQNEELIMIVDAKMYQYDNSLLTEDVLGKQFGYYKEAKKKYPDTPIINVLILPEEIINADTLGFQDYVICDPHSDYFEKDAYNFILVYKLSFETIMKIYFYGEKCSEKIIEDYHTFMSSDNMKSFIAKRTSI